MLRLNSLLILYYVMCLDNGSKAMIISDSIAKDLHYNKAANIIALGGYTVKDLLQYLRCNPTILDQCEYVLIHIGTNNFGSKADWRAYKQYARRYGSSHAQVLYGDRQLMVDEDFIEVFRQDYRDIIEFVLAIPQ